MSSAVGGDAGPRLGQAEGWRKFSLRGWPFPPGALPFVFLLAGFFVAPVVYLFQYAFANGASFWTDVFRDPSTSAVVGRTLLVACETTLLCTVIGYLYCGALLRLRGPARAILIAAVLVPLLTSVLVRSYAWIIVLGDTGPLVSFLSWISLGHINVQLLYNRVGLLIGMTHVLLPLFVLPLYAVMSQIPQSYTRAARSLGANRVQLFLRVTLPLSLPGAAAGALLVFINALGFFVTPSLLGGDGDTMVAQLIDRELSSRFLDLNTAAVLATGLLGAVVIILLTFQFVYPLEVLFVQRLQAPRRRFRLWARFWPAQARPSNAIDRMRGGGRLASGAISALPWGAISLVCAVATAIYFIAPLAVIIPVSFTGESYLHFPPSSLSLRWYQTVLSDPLWRDAAWHSLLVGLGSTLLSFLIGLPLAFALVRSRMHDRLKGILILGMILPVVVPVIVLALGMFIWFLQIGALANLPALSGAHALLGIPFFTLVVMATLRDYDTRLDRAARSMGAGPLTTLRLITLPIIRTALLAGLFFAFLQSFDELLIARAVTDESTYTLPIRIWNGANESISPGLAVVSTVNLVLAVIAVAAVAGLRRGLSRGRVHG